MTFKDYKMFSLKKIVYVKKIESLKEGRESMLARDDTEYELWDIM